MLVIFYIFIVHSCAPNLVPFGDFFFKINPNVIHLKIQMFFSLKNKTLKVIRITKIVLVFSSIYYIIIT